MRNSGRGALGFFIGVTVGVGIGMLCAPKSGEEIREWISDAADRKFRVLRRQSRRWISEAQDALEKGEDTVTRVLKSSRNALDSVASKFD